MRIYLDACCLNRPFDDLSQDRVYHEAEAVLSIIARCESGEWVLLKSAVLDFEILNLKDKERLANVQALYTNAGEMLFMTDQTVSRAEYFREKGIKLYDSLHLALAEINGADVFLTTDDRLLKTAKRLRSCIHKRFSSTEQWEIMKCNSSDEVVIS